MSVIKDFPCTYQNSSGICPEIVSTLDVKFPDAYMTAEGMAQLSKALQKHDGAIFCEMPLCHTVEAEALGGDITPGDAVCGPRCRKPVFQSLEDFDTLSEMDFETGILKEVLSACRILSNAGENVVLELSGPFTIAGALIDLGQLFLGFCKSPEKVLEIFRRIGKMQLAYAKKAMDCGVRYISYGDAPGGVNIIGPKYAAFVAENFTYDFVKTLSDLTAGRAFLLLCPKTTFALVGSALAEFHDVPLPQPMTYQEACLALFGTVSISGQTCMKNIHHILPGVFKEIRLTERSSQKIC